MFIDNPNMCLGDILPFIARNHKLRLFSDEYAFAVTPEDQARFKIASPIVDLNVKFQSLGIRELELQKRHYADTPKVSRPLSKTHQTTDQLANKR